MTESKGGPAFGKEAWTTTVQHPQLPIKLAPLLPVSTPQMVDMNSASLSGWLYKSGLDAEEREAHIREHDEKILANSDEVRIAVYRPWREGTGNDSARVNASTLADGADSDGRDPNGEMLASAKWVVCENDAATGEVSARTDTGRDFSGTQADSKTNDVFALMEKARDMAMKNESRYYHLSRIFLRSPKWEGWRPAADAQTAQTGGADNPPTDLQSKGTAMQDAAKKFKMMYAEVARMVIQWGTKRADADGVKAFIVAEENQLPFFASEGFERWQHPGIGEGVENETGVIRVDTGEGREMRRVVMIREPGAKGKPMGQNKAGA